jgi:hypothetical protein
MTYILFNQLGYCFGVIFKFLKPCFNLVTAHGCVAIVGLSLLENSDIYGHQHFRHTPAGLVVGIDEPCDPAVVFPVVFAPVVVFAPAGLVVGSGLGCGCPQGRRVVGLIHFAADTSWAWNMTPKSEIIIAAIVTIIAT